MLDGKLLTPLVKISLMTHQQAPLNKEVAKRPLLVSL
jgi:hypothetical protein